jgi:SAM-dependent methyltransferase
VYASVERDLRPRGADREEAYGSPREQQETMAFTDRFTTRAGAYVASRPSYPSAAIDALFEGLGDPAALVVADIGAGTGISARLVAARGPRVLAIEPNAAMRGAASDDPRVEWIAATAERTTLADASVDVAAAFQSWHWLDHSPATAEARRIVRPGGYLAILYNERDERDPLTAGYGEIVRRHARDATEQRRANALANALSVDPARTTRAEFAHAQPLDRAGLHARAESSSYLPQSGAAAAAMHADIDRLLDRFGVTAGLEMKLVTIVIRIAL